MLRDQLLTKQSAASLRHVTAAKVAGLLNLGCLARHHPTAMVVPFSSIAALLGNAGQCNYSAANAAMDAWSSQMQNNVSQLVLRPPQRLTNACKDLYYLYLCRMYDFEIFQGGDVAYYRFLIALSRQQRPA